MVRFKSTKTGASSVPRTGTIVELFGSEAALIEVSDESGIPEEFVSVPIRDLEIVWDSTKATAKEEIGDEAQQSFEEGLLLLQNAILGAAMEKFRKAFERQPDLARVLLNLTTANRGDRKS